MIGTAMLAIALFAAPMASAQRFRHGPGMQGRFGRQEPPGYFMGPRGGERPRYGSPEPQFRPYPRRGRPCPRGSGGTIIGAIAGGLLGGGGSGRAIDRGCY